MALQQMTDKKKHIFGDLVGSVQQDSRRKQSLKNDRFI